VDACPYIFKREGTNCENLPETHEFYKKLRSFVDMITEETNKPRILLLGEANQWPHDVIQYFGFEDEFNMNYHFPVMPRIFMSLGQQSSIPMREILKKTPELPAVLKREMSSCAWGIFLRNHDELTLEMVSDEERALMGFLCPRPKNAS
jgi:maltose alpha-D-glucosyltransferase/alpha-amylase